MTATRSPSTSTCPPLPPTLVASSLPPSTSVSPVALRKILPPSLTTLLAFKRPLFLTMTPAMPMRPASAVIVPRLVALPAAPVMSTLTPGVALSIRLTV
ncbi:MAG: hypothetical protein K8R10_02880, partial [Rhodocyclales bacterium]|nr:hypothetical protein [Rhodocyclales bacterium]